MMPINVYDNTSVLSLQLGQRFPYTGNKLLTEVFTCIINMDTIQKELELIKAKVKDINGVELIACVPAMVRVKIT